MMLLSKDLGIDLGTANTLVYVQGEGIVLNEPSVVAYNTVSQEVLSVGEEAKTMVGRTPSYIVAVRPMKFGVIADFTTTKAMLKYFFNEVNKSVIKAKPQVIICIPYGVTEVERNAIIEVAIEAGSKKNGTYLIEEPMAAAIGAGLPVNEARGSMIVDIGGGTTEVAIISMGGIVNSRSVRVAGDAIDEAIISYIRREFNLMIGDRTAENIKMTVGYAYVGDDDPEETMDVKGRDLVTGLPKTITVTNRQICDAIHEPVYSILDSIHYALEKTPPELSADILDYGIMLSGGGALLKNLDKLITMETGIETHIAKEPLNCVVKGTGMVLEDLKDLSNVLISSRNLGV